MKKIMFHILFIVTSICVFSNSMTLIGIEKNISGSSYCVTVSPNQKCVTYVKGDSNFMYGQLYIWRVGSNQSQKVLSVEDRICELTFSLDSNILLADIGTSALRTVIVVSPSKGTKLGQFDFVGSAIFSPNSSRIAYGSVSRVKPKVATEINGVVDLSLYFVDKKSSATLLKATSNQSFEPISWKGSNLIYKCYNLAQGSSQNLMLTAKP